MAESDSAEILTTILNRQSDLEKVQATHEQVLTNLVESSGHIVERIEKIETGIHSRFDRIEERQRFPVGHLLTIIGIAITLLGITFGGFAYLISLSFAPTQNQLDNLQKKVEQIEVDNAIRFKEDDSREGDDKARFSTIEQRQIQHGSLIERVRDLEKYCWTHQVKFPPNSQH